MNKQVVLKGECNKVLTAIEQIQPFRIHPLVFVVINLHICAYEITLLKSMYLIAINILFATRDEM